MAGPAPTEFLQHTKDRDEKLNKEIANNSTKAGHPVTSQSVNPSDESELDNIREMFGDIQHDAIHVATTTVNPEDSAKIRIAKEKAPTSIAVGRWLKRKLLKKAA